MKLQPNGALPKGRKSTSQSLMTNGGPRMSQSQSLPMANGHALKHSQSIDCGAGLMPLPPEKSKKNTGILRRLSTLMEPIKPSSSVSDSNAIQMTKVGDVPCKIISILKFPLTLRE